MDEKKRLLAIINPISGGAHRVYMPDAIKRVFDGSEFDVVARFTQRPGHATDLARAAISQGFYGVIAVGGDGTVNEIATALIDTGVALGIVPCGSGNGLARHLEIPMACERALRVVRAGKVEALDYCTVCGVPFFCTCGVGFDARVSQRFAQAKKRGPISYARNAVSEYLQYRSEEYIVRTSGGESIEHAFVIACGNASQYGNNAYIAPEASMHDGLIDVTIIHPFSHIAAPVIGIQLFSRQLNQNTNIRCFRTPALTILRPKDGLMHLDGEPRIMPAQLDIACHHQGIRFFVPGPDSRSIFTPIENGIYDFVNAIRTELKI